MVLVCDPDCDRLGLRAVAQVPPSWELQAGQDRYAAFLGTLLWNDSAEPQVAPVQSLHQTECIAAPWSRGRTPSPASPCQARVQVATSAPAPSVPPGSGSMFSLQV